MLTKLDFSRQTFEESPNIKFQQKPSSGNQVVPYGRTDGQTDRHDEANSRYSELCERSYKGLFSWQTQQLVFLQRSQIVFTSLYEL